jgi:hypothetical protein
MATIGTTFGLDTVVLMARLKVALLLLAVQLDRDQRCFGVPKRQAAIPYLNFQRVLKRRIPQIGYTTSRNDAQFSESACHRTVIGQPDYFSGLPGTHTMKMCHVLSL